MFYLSELVIFHYVNLPQGRASKNGDLSLGVLDLAEVLTGFFFWVRSSQFPLGGLLTGLLWLTVPH